ncbi:hypothetical protein ACA910_017920 [Epithemia clementina (nom. ined.)]
MRSILLDIYNHHSKTRTGGESQRQHQQREKPSKQHQEHQQLQQPQPPPQRRKRKGLLCSLSCVLWMVLVFLVSDSILTSLNAPSLNMNKNNKSDLVVKAIAMATGDNHKHNVSSTNGFFQAVLDQLIFPIHNNNNNKRQSRIAPYWILPLSSPSPSQYNLSTSPKEQNKNTTIQEYENHTVASNSSMIANKPQELSNRNTTASYRQRNVEFLTVARDFSNNLGQAYAGAWWQAVPRFRGMTPSRISNREGAVFAAFRGDRRSTGTTTRDIYLTRDWLEFSVEHLSKWYKIVDYDHPQTRVAFHRIMVNLLQYILIGDHSDRGGNEDNPMTKEHKEQQEDLPPPPSRSLPPISSQEPMNRTIAVVAYGSLFSKLDHWRATSLDTVVLTATLWSLIRQGIGRIVVVTDRAFENHSRQTIWPACRALLQRRQADEALTRTSITTSTWQHIFNETTTLFSRPLHYKVQQEQEQPNHGTFRIGSTSLLLVSVDAAIPEKPHIKNIPRAALQTIHTALFQNDSSHSKNNHSRNHTETRQQQQQPEILGDGPMDRWKYVYYTEQDSILRMRQPPPPSQDEHEHHHHQQFQQVLDQGKILVPHRLQPLPHESDLGITPRAETSTSSSSNMTATSDLTTTTKPKRIEELVEDPPLQTFLPAIGPWQNVVNLQSQDSCCDAGKLAYPYKLYPKCPRSTLWFLCGFGQSPLLLDRKNHKNSTIENHNDYNDPSEQQQQQEQQLLLWHERLSNYTLICMSTSQGSGLVHLGASNHGRQCIPRLASQGPCPSLS